MLMPVRVLAVVCAVVLSLAPLRAEALDASSAADVCATNADPCIVNETVHVAPGAILDFGTRQVSVVEGGTLDFGAGSARIWSGPFVATTRRDAIVATGPGADGGSDSGTVLIAARRSCSAGSPPAACAGDDECQLGTCSTRRCSTRPQFTCNGDLDCQVGPCLASHHCAASPTFLRCETDADCDFGTCPAQLSCSRFTYAGHECSDDSECDLGTCTSGDPASITIDGAIEGSSEFPASITLRAADSVSIGGPVDLTGRSLESDGGDLTIETGHGDVTIAAKVRVRSGGAATGGTVEVDSGRDVTVSGALDVSGGDFDGGTIDIAAAQDITIDANLSANSKKGAGYGGDILVAAGRDLAIGGGSHPIRMTNSAHRDGENFSGDAGLIDLTAVRHATIAPNVRILSFGSMPDGYGGQLFLDVADGDLAYGGQLFARTRGAKGAGGIVSFTASGDISIAESAKIDLRGGSGGGGDALIESSEGDVEIGGKWLTSGFDDTSTSTFQVDACRIRLTGSVQNKADNGRTTLTAHESMQILAGSVLSTPQGNNTLIYRTADKPPVVAGTVSPVAVLEIGLLSGCPVCGNDEIDETETCDDGNTADGDGCSSACLLE